MAEGLIDNQDDFESLCEQIRVDGLVAFDTEFVSEYSYNPELCLLQFATENLCRAVDPFAIDDLSSWWKIMADDETIVIVHGGQAEVKFCLVEGHLKPRRMIDLQIAEAFRGRSYPLSYVNLVSRVLNKKVHGKETRTDWKRRPLLPNQAKYALEDVEFALPIWKKQESDLQQRGRLDWTIEETRQMVEEIADDLVQPAWLRLPGLHRLGRRELAVAREIFQWREEEARQRNKPARTVFRDDLILELARRQPKNAKELSATRDMERDRYKRHIDELVDVVQRAVALPSSEFPEKLPSQRQDNSQDDHVIGKLLSLALANLCSEMDMAMAIIATSSDLRELVRWSLNGRDPNQKPALLKGWRAQVCGELLMDVLDGKISLRVADPESDHPLVFERE